MGRWGSIDSLMEKHYDYSPYNYVLDNPLMYIDPDGRQVKQFFRWGLKKLDNVKTFREIGKRLGLNAGSGELGVDNVNPEFELREKREKTMSSIQSLDIPQHDIGTEESLKIIRQRKGLKQIEINNQLREAAEKIKITPIQLENIRQAQGQSTISNKQAEKMKLKPQDPIEMEKVNNKISQSTFYNFEEGLERPKLKFTREDGPL